MTKKKTDKAREARVAKIAALSLFVAQCTRMDGQRGETKDKLKRMVVGMARIRRGRKEVNMSWVEGEDGRDTSVVLTNKERARPLGHRLG